MTININQFQQTPVRGALDLQISKSGVIMAQVSTNQATALKAGDFVKLDTAQTGNVPQVVAAGASDTGFGSVMFDVKKATFIAGDYLEVVGAFGPVMFVVAGGTIQVGALVEDKADGTVQTKASAKQRGIALDPGVSGQLMRIILTNPTV